MNQIILMIIIKKYNELRDIYYNQLGDDEREYWRKLEAIEIVKKSHIQHPLLSSFKDDNNQDVIEFKHYEHGNGKRIIDVQYIAVNMDWIQLSNWLNYDLINKTPSKYFNKCSKEYNPNNDIYKERENINIKYYLINTYETHASVIAVKYDEKTNLPLKDNIYFHADGKWHKFLGIIEGSITTCSTSDMKPKYKLQ